MKILVSRLPGGVWDQGA